MSVCKFYSKITQVYEFNFNATFIKGFLSINFYVHSQTLKKAITLNTQKKRTQRV